MKFPDSEQIKAIAQNFGETEQKVEEDLILLLKNIFDNAPHLVTKSGIDILRINNQLSNKELFKWFLKRYDSEITLVLMLLFVTIEVIARLCFA